MNSQIPTINVFWFRRDLRFHDNAALYHALRSGDPVVPIFIFDTEILDDLDDREDRRVEFIHHALSEMQQILLGIGSSMEVFHGKPFDVFKKMYDRYRIGKVYTNHDYEPYARGRDKAIGNFLQGQGTEFITYKDQVVFEKSEVVKDDGLPYTVFTPYSRKWRALLANTGLAVFHTEAHFDAFFRQAEQKIPTLSQIGFRSRGLPFPSKEIRDALIVRYGEDRNFPGIPGTSRLGVHLRFGTISIRELARKAMSLNETFLSELIWRDFYHMILWHFPRVGEGKAFKPAYEQIGWRNNEDEFARWCAGTTGYPIVDAGMRELNATGFMHNRVRMITASFLTKHLLIDWRWGEAYFAGKLLDFDLAANNGGWQWAAGSGCDAAPYFRVFNPTLQMEKFDKKGTYLRQWVPEYFEMNYPQPMVEHSFARKRCLDAYGAVLKPAE
jgi:deoxyribodipyrimidine photo-lyase